MAVPAWTAKNLLPGVKTPTEFRAIVNAHFNYLPPAGHPALVGVTGGIVEWLFAFDNRFSITISNGDRFVNLPREEFAQQIWDEICKLSHISAPLPAWQIVRERRATFAATPAQDALRAGTRTEFKNLFLAGDWTDTGLPATIEGSIRSGDRAADMALGKV
jgi:hydroxysqualene dehydroxylase